MSYNIFKYFILPIVFFIVSIAVTFWVLFHIYNDIKLTVELKKQNENNLKDRIELTRSLEGLIKQYNQRLDVVDSLSKITPEGQNIPDILVNLEALASESGLTFSSVNFSPKDLKASGVKTLVLAIRVKGSYSAFRNYLDSMEKSLRIFDVMSISFNGISRGKSDVKTNNLEFNLKVNTYYQ